MISMIAYRRVIDAVTTHSLRLPDAPQGQQAGQELATLADGRTIVAIFDGFAIDLAKQPAAIKASVETLALTDALRDEIKAASPQVQLIYTRTEDMIRSRYGISDEAKYARIGVGVALSMYPFGPGEQAELVAFGAYVEQCRQWGRDERAKLGL
jgi:hypothetical protein